jgi:hypothetical protein
LNKISEYFSLIPFQIEEEIWCLITLSFLNTLLLKTRDQFSSECNISQHNFKSEASLSLDKLLIPKPPSEKGLQTLAQETVTNFLFEMSPLQMKYWRPRILFVPLVIDVDKVQNHY